MRKESQRRSGGKAGTSRWNRREKGKAYGGMNGLETLALIAALVLFFALLAG